MKRDFRGIADGLADEILGGRLAPGTRLPPQRDFAYRRGIAISTASRVYRELIRRGLVIGEIGRGTFVTAPVSAAAALPMLSEPSDSPFDLAVNLPMAPEQAAMLSDGLAQVTQRPRELDAALRPVGAAGTAAARDAAAGFLARSGWSPAPAAVLFAGSGKQAIAAALAALVPRGGRLGVEALTYPVIKSIAERLGIALVPIAVDEAGLRPDALAAAHRATPLRALYVQPTLHNPLGMTMPETRRRALAKLLHELDLFAIEDTVYGFLADAPPLADHAPERVILVDSLSKRLAAGLTVGYLVVPPPLRDAAAAALRSGGWLASGFALAVACRWIADGSAAAVIAAKHREAATRQAIARQCLAGLEFVADPRSYHCWLTLPADWRSELFVAAAAQRGIAVMPAIAFAAAPGHAPNAVRLALAAPPLEQLTAALKSLAALARAPAEAWRSE